jgi:hypothetical protein
LRLKLLLPAVLTVLLMVSSVQNAFAAVVDQKQENFVGGTGAVSARHNPALSRVQSSRVAG